MPTRGIKQRIFSRVLTQIERSKNGMLEEEIVKDIKSDPAAKDIDEKQVLRLLEKVYNCGYVKRRLIWNPTRK